MSFNSPFFDFFDAISNEVDNFSRMMDPRYRPYRAPRGHKRVGPPPPPEERGRPSPGPAGRELARPRGPPPMDLVYRPFSDLDDWFDNDFSLVPADFGVFDHLTVPVDLYDQEENYVIHVTVPGVKSKDDISLEYHQNKNQIVISGEIPNSVTEDNRPDIKVKERVAGKFRRVISLPESPKIDADNIKADYSSGVLTLTIPKVKPEKGEKPHVRKIEISSQDAWDE